MTFAQIALMALLPIGALLMLGFVKLHAFRNPPARQSQSHDIQIADALAKRREPVSAAGR